MNSTGFFGFQPWLPATATEVVMPSAKAPANNDFKNRIMFLHNFYTSVYRLFEGGLSLGARHCTHTHYSQTLAREDGRHFCSCFS
jgi:hypothetical protein